MKISQILIESQTKRKQITGRLVSGMSDEAPEAYCAIGAMLCEVGLITRTSDASKYSMLGFKSWIDKFGITIVQYECPYRCPKCSNMQWNLGSLVIHLNDLEKYTFEQIGKHLEAEGL